MFNDYLDQIFLMVLTTFLFTALIMPFTNKIAEHIGAIDIPKDNRRVHNKPIPKLGGLGIFAGFLFGYMLYGIHSVQMNSILIGSFIIILYGIMDDIKPLSAKCELLGQLIAASTIAFYGQILLSEVTFFGQTIEFGLFAYPITIFFILGCTNVIRLIDGIDGLSSGISSIFYLTIGIIAFFQDRVETLEITLTFIMLGSTLGFLVHNFHPAKLFAGESGSAFMLFAIIRRKLKGKPIFEADKEHLHHQFIKMNYSQRRTVLIIYAIDLLFSIASILYVLKDPYFGIIIYIVLLLIVIWFILHTGIISEKLENKVKQFEHTLTLKK